MSLTDIVRKMATPIPSRVKCDGCDATVENDVMLALQSGWSIPTIPGSGVGPVCPDCQRRRQGE